MLWLISNNRNWQRLLQLLQHNITPRPHILELLHGRHPQHQASPRTRYKLFQPRYASASQPNRCHCYYLDSNRPRLSMAKLWRVRMIRRRIILHMCRIRCCLVKLHRVTRGWWLLRGLYLLRRHYHLRLPRER
jgi:hypothetical protein